jgi:hypothetical protein
MLTDFASLIGSENKHAVYLEHAHTLNLGNEHDDHHN